MINIRELSENVVSTTADVMNWSGLEDQKRSAIKVKTVVDIA